MAKYVIDEKILKDVADAIRTKGDTSELITPLSMPDKILSLEVMPDTIIFVDEYGNEYTAYLIDDSNNN